MAFNLGSLGFLTNYLFEDYKKGIQVCVLGEGQRLSDKGGLQGMLGDRQQS